MSCGNLDVLILTASDDVHAQAVSRVLELEYGAKAHFWDFSRFPHDRASFRPDSAGSSFTINDLPLDAFRSVWWRRPGEFEVSPLITDEPARQFCIRESDSFIHGAFVSSGIKLVNDPCAQRLANHKAHQLHIAKKVGLTIPATLMTNDPDEAREFWHANNRQCVYKTFRPSPTHILETRLLSEEDLQDLGKVSYAPIIFQRKIDKGLDIRVNVFGDELHAASVHVNNPVGDLDWRLDLTASWRVHKLPSDIQDRIYEFLSELRLEYGCIDMRQDPRGEYFFLR